MSTNIIILPILLLFFTAIIAIPILLGVYVYRDTKSRGMDAVLWTLVTLIAPGLLGLIIYLIVRKEHIVLNCPNCGGEVQEHFASCPNCGQKLRAGCPNCGTALNPGWRICPQCGREITETLEFTPPVPNGAKGNNGLMALIIAVVVIPILLIILLIVGCVGVFTANTFSSSTADIVDINDVVNDVIPYDYAEIFNADDIELDDKYVKWIAEKKNQPKGIYCLTWEESESGGLTPANGSNDYAANYDFTYKYMILVINPPEGKSFNLVKYSIDDTDGIIVEKPSIMLDEVDAMHGDEYGNVFVIRFMSKCSINVTDKNGGNDSVKSEYENYPLTVNILESDNSVEYLIPTDQKESYTEFSQNVNK